MAILKYFLITFSMVLVSLMVNLLLEALWGPREDMACRFIAVPLLSLTASGRDLLKISLLQILLGVETAFCLKASLTRCDGCAACQGWEDLLCWAAGGMTLLAVLFQVQGPAERQMLPAAGQRHTFFHAISSAFDARSLVGRLA